MADERGRLWIAATGVVEVSTGDVMEQSDALRSDAYTIEGEGEKLSVWGVSSDISGKGVGILIPVNIKTGTTVELVVHLTGHHPSTARLTAKVEHSTPDHGGWMCGLSISGDNPKKGEGNREDLNKWVQEVRRRAMDSTGQH